MKILLPLMLAVGLQARAQFYQDDQGPEQGTARSSVAAVSYRFLAPLEYFDLKCGNPVYAQLGGGVSDFAAAFKKSVAEVMDSGQYAPEGPFSLVFTIEKDGALSQVDVLPKVQNSQYLAEDLAAMMKKNMPKFQPASCGGTAVPSKFRVRLSFDSDSADF